MPYCPKCGNEVTDEQEYCGNCGFNLKTGESPRGVYEEVGAIEHLTRGINIATEKPMVFVPAMLGALISVLISFFSWGDTWTPPSNISSLFYFTSLFSIVGGIFMFLLNFASIDMSRDAYLDRPLNVMDSLNYVLRRIIMFILASIVGAVISITIILIPVVILMFVIIVVDETGIGDSLSKAFSVLTRDLGDVIIILIITIIGSFALGLVPFLSSFLQAALNVIVGIAFIDIYFQHKRRRSL